MNETLQDSLIDVRALGKTFGSVIALQDISMRVSRGEVMALLGDNGAGKSTLIKCLSGVYTPDQGQIFMNGHPVTFANPREAMAHGIATVYQDLAMIPLLSIARNFFLGAEPTTGWGPFRRFDQREADRVARAELARMGIDIRATTQAVGTLSGGDRHPLAIARAVHFGARLLILDEPTSALGVKEVAIVLRYIESARDRGVGVIFITHNVRHAYPISNAFTILNRGRCYGTFQKEDITRDEVTEMMAGNEPRTRAAQALE